MGIDGVVFNREETIVALQTMQAIGDKHYLDLSKEKVKGSEKNKVVLKEHRPWLWGKMPNDFSLIEKIVNAAICLLPERGTPTTPEITELRGLILSSVRVMETRKLTALKWHGQDTHDKFSHLKLLLSTAYNSTTNSTKVMIIPVAGHYTPDAEVNAKIQQLAARNAVQMLLNKDNNVKKRNPILDRLTAEIQARFAQVVLKATAPGEPKPPIGKVFIPDNVKKLLENKTAPAKSTLTATAV